MVFGSGTEGFKAVDMKSKDEESLVVSVPPAVGTGIGAMAGIDIVLFEVMSA